VADYPIEYDPALINADHGPQLVVEELLLAVFDPILPYRGVISPKGGGETASRRSSSVLAGRRSGEMVFIPSITIILPLTRYSDLRAVPRD